MWGGGGGAKDKLVVCNAGVHNNTQCGWPYTSKTRRPYASVLIKTFLAGGQGGTFVSKRYFSGSQWIV